MLKLMPILELLISVLEMKRKESEGGILDAIGEKNNRNSHNVLLIFSLVLKMLLLLLLLLLLFVLFFLFFATIFTLEFLIINLISI